MLATLKEGISIGLIGGENRFSSLITSMPFRFFSDGGQGPEKPVIDEVDFEEDVFTFAYPEKGGDISDLVNPPVEGIAGNVMHTEAKLIDNPANMGDSPNIFSYLFFDPAIERPMIAVGPEFVSLTRQSSIVISYGNLLVYSGYGVSDANVSYLSDEPYESQPLARDVIHYRGDNPLYENKALMPIFSERFVYQAKADDSGYVSDIAQPGLQVYENMIQDEINIRPIVFSQNVVMGDNAPDQDYEVLPKLDYKSLELELAPILNLDLNIFGNENEVGVFHLPEDSYVGRDITVLVNQPFADIPVKSISDLISRPDLKQDYKSQKLELPLIRNEPRVLDDNIETDKAALPLYGLSPAVRDLAVQISLPKLDEVVVPKDYGAKVEYNALDSGVSLPANLGFDDTLLRDRFAARLNGLAMETERQDTTLRNIDSYELQGLDYQDIRLNDEVGVPEVKLSEQEYVDVQKIDSIQLRKDIGYIQDLTFLSEPVQQTNYVGKSKMPLSGFDGILLRDRSADTLNLRAIEHYRILPAGFEDGGNDAVGLYVDEPRGSVTLSYGGMGDATSLPDKLDVMVDGARSNLTNGFNIEYDVQSFNFSLDSLPMMYDRAMTSLDPYALFNLAGSDVQTDYQSGMGARGLLLPNVEYGSRADLGDIVEVGYDDPSLQRDSAMWNDTGLDLTDLQIGIEADLMDDPDYEGVYSEQNIDDVVEQEKELAEEGQNVLGGAYDDGDAQKEVYEENGISGKTETNESSDSSVGYAAAAAVGAVGFGLFGLLSSVFSSSKDDDGYLSKDKEGYMQEEPEIKKETPEEENNTKKCGYNSAKDSEKGIDSSDFIGTTQLDGEESKKLCFNGIDEASIDPESFAKAEKTLGDSDKEGTKEFCFKEIKEGENGYVNIDGIEYKSYSTLSVSKEYRQRLENNPEKSIINIRGKNGGDLTSQYKVSNKSVIAALYAYAMDDTENDGKGLTIDVRLDRDLEKYETLNEGKLTINGVFGLDDFDSQYIIQAVKRDESGNIVERFFPRGEDGEFLSVSEELPELYKDHDIELVRLESKGEKEWQKDEEVNLRLLEVNQDSERILKDGRYAPLLSQLTDEDGNSIGRAYIVGDSFQITEEDIQNSGIYSVDGERAVDKDENYCGVDLKSDGLLAILDRKLQEQGLDAIHKTMPTQKNRIVLRDNEVYMKDIAGLHEQLGKIHSYVPKERWSMLVVEEDPDTGELSEPGYDPEKGMQFTPELGKRYRIIVGDGSDISRARIKTDSIDYQKEQIAEKRAEPIPV